ncbi:MAG: methylamine utilization protein [Pontixanthobacter sp.]
MSAVKKLILSSAAACIAVPTASLLAAGPSQSRIQIVDENGLPVRDAVVEIATANSDNASIKFPWRAAMAQRDLQFAPGTLVVAQGSSVAFPNLDRVRHSIYSFSKAARFEIDLYGRDQTRRQAFMVTGAVSLGCKIHDNMRGYVRVVDTPYAGKTDHNGIMAVSGVPSGAARVTVWHPRLRAPGNQSSQSVTVSGALSKKYSVRLK